MAASATGAEKGKHQYITNGGQNDIAVLIKGLTIVSNRFQNFQRRWNADGGCLNNVTGRGEGITTVLVTEQMNGTDLS